MSSIIEGYNYDIFISYRQKDNKYDGWVTEFVDHLMAELEATFKEEISVYFDINPHDGLLETHDVDASLKEKLKCLVFIPIISRTYCDPKSFAWEHEFKAFVKQASQDQFGLKIKLHNGNVASRVLPVRIYDLDTPDIKLYELALGGVLRSVDFIYKSAGVNRPLRASEDHPQDNLNKTYYRDQINKVANSIKEIITAIRENEQSQEEVTEEVQKPASVTRNKHKATITAGSIIALALIILGYIFIPKLLKPSKTVEKSIAVLPFVNDSPDQENTYFINGIMDEILNNLQKIKDFRVLSRTSAEQYRGSNKPAIPKIAKELGVNYIVEGSGQKYGNKFVLRVQLIAAKNEKHLWGESFEREIKETNDIIDLQSQIARSIAEELKATITPEEKHMIEKIPTTNLSAYDFYQRGREELLKSGFYEFDREAVKRAEVLFHKALEYDSTFAKAYFGLGMVILNKWIYDHVNLKSKNLNDYLDSSMIMAEKALSYDNKLAEAYIIRGFYYSIKGSTNQAIGEWEKALIYNPSFWQAYWQIGSIYEELDILKSLQNFQKAATLNHGSELIEMFEVIGEDYYLAGFPERGNFYLLEAFKLDADSVKYKDNLTEHIAQTQSDYIKKATEYFKKRYLTDSTNTDILCHLGYYNSLIGNYQESLKYYKKYVSILKTNGETIPSSINYTSIVTHIGYAYLQNGYTNEAEYYFDKQIEANNSRLTSVRPGERIYWTYPLAGIYACKGDKTKAYKNLRIFSQNLSFTLDWVMLLKNDPMFNSIRSEAEFQEIISDVEAKYQAEHERVKKWMEEQGKQ